MGELGFSTNLGEVVPWVRKTETEFDTEKNENYVEVELLVIKEIMYVQNIFFIYTEAN